MSRELYKAEEILKGIPGRNHRGMYDGPDMEWTCPLLSASCPEPQIALSRQYTETNDLEDEFGKVDFEYMLMVAFQAGVENGYRIGRNEADDLDALKCDL